MLERRLELGTKLYYVEESNHALSRKKIFMKDENGVEWYRYDRELFTQTMTEHTIVGRVLVDIEGVVPSAESYHDTYIMEDGVEVDDYAIDDPDRWNGYFLDKDEALEWIEAHKREADGIERS